MKEFRVLGCVSELYSSNDGANTYSVVGTKTDVGGNVSTDMSTYNLSTSEYTNITGEISGITFQHTCILYNTEFNIGYGVVNISSNVTGFGGVKYGADYSANYTARSLVDKYYVDSVATGLNVHGAVSLATTSSDGNLPLTGLTESIDGVVVSAITSTNNRILVKNQTDGSENGIYSATTGSWGRTADYNFEPSGEISNGDLIPVLSGSSNANTQWILVTQNPIISGDTLTYSLFSQQQGIIDGNGICVTTVGGNRQVDVKLSGSNPGLCFDATALELDYNIFSSGLTVTTGSVSVNADNSTIIGSEIPVRFGTSCALVVDSNDFSYSLASNGLTKTGSYITLGGALTGDTTITGGGLYDLNLNTLDSFALGFDNGAVITDSAGTPHGICYAGNYGSGFVDRSLVDKGWVNTAITGTTYTVLDDGSLSS